MRRTRLFATLLVAPAAACSAAVAWAGGQPTTKRVDLDSRGQAHGTLPSDPVFSGTGRYIAFAGNGAWLRDRRRGTLRLASLSQRDRPVRDGIFDVALSGDGRYVAFSTPSPEVVRGDTNQICFTEEDGGTPQCDPATDVFVRDRVRGTTRRVSVSGAERQADGESFGPEVSRHGRYVAFTSSAPNLVRGDTNRETDVFVRDRRRGTTTRVGPGTLDAMTPSGRYVLFTSSASDLVANDGNDSADQFLYDRRRRTTTLVSVGEGGQQGDAESGFGDVSANGSRVVFRSAASNLVPGDTNGALDIFVRDLSKRTTSRVSVRHDPNADDAEDPFGGESLYPAISADGRYAAFASFSSKLVEGDEGGHLDVFVRDLDRGVTRLASVGSNGEQANGYSAQPSLSAHGSYVLFESAASNLGGKPPGRNRSGIFMRGPLHP